MLWMGRERAQIRHWREEAKPGFSSARLVGKTEAERKGANKLTDARKTELVVFPVFRQREAEL